MPCNMAAKGESLGIVEADGEKSLGDLLRAALSRIPAKEPGKVSGLLDIAGDGCEINLLVDKGDLVAACLDCTRRGTFLSSRALSELMSLLSETPRSGYLEPMKLESEAISLDLELEPQAGLPEPLPVDRALEETTISEARKPMTGAPQPAASEEPGEEGDTAKPSPKPPPAALEAAGEPGTVDAAQLASMLVYLLDKSRVVLHARGLRRLLLEARKASSRDREAFYRAVVEVRGNGIFNAFYYGGRLCSVVYLDPSSFQAQFLRGLDEDRLAEKISEVAGERGIELMLLYRVDCPDCARVFLADCFTEQEKKEAREGKRGGLLARLFGRRK